MQSNNDYKENNENREGTDMPQGARFSPYTVNTHIPRHWRAVALCGVACMATGWAGLLDSRALARPSMAPTWWMARDGMLIDGEGGRDLELTPTPLTSEYSQLLWKAQGAHNNKNRIQSGKQRK
jgi:hypothetical protein